MRLYGTMDNSFYMMELNCSVKQLLTDTFLYNQLSDSQVRVCQGGNLPWPVVATWPSLYFTSWPLDSIVLRFRIWPNNTSIFTSFLSISLPPAFSLCKAKAGPLIRDEQGLRQSTRYTLFWSNLFALQPEVWFVNIYPMSTGGRFSSYHHDRLLVGWCTLLFLDYSSGL